MIQNNQVQLIGTIIEGSLKRVALSNGGFLLTFSLMTKELWHFRNQETSEHIEIHKITLRDVGNYRMASRYGAMLKDNMKILLTGHLRYKVFRDSSNNKSDRITEIDADGLEFLGMDPSATELLRNAGYKFKGQSEQAESAQTATPVDPAPQNTVPPVPPMPEGDMMPYGQAAAVNNPYMPGPQA